jgi:predicted ATPase
VPSLPGFTIDRSNAEAADRLCRRLDRIPLALELAAVRLEGLTLEQLVAGLERDLPVFTGRNRGAEARQQTLEATIGWSYRLLGVEERLLWARLSAFAGGFDELAATEVCTFSGLAPEHIPELIASLVEKSIVQRDPTVRPPRLSMLETVRQYGRRRLQELGEEADVLGRHCDWILGLATKAAAYDHGRVDAHQRMDLERDNLFSALDFCLRTGQAEAGIDICALNVDYWLGHGPLREVRRILSSLEAITHEYSAARARAMTVGALLAVTQADVAVAESMARESLSIGQRLGDSEVVCWGRSAPLRRPRPRQLRGCRRTGPLDDRSRPLLPVVGGTDRSQLPRHDQAG